MSTDTPSIADSHHPQWNHGRIKSSIGQERKIYLIVAIFWNAIAHSVFWLNALNNPEVKGWPLLLMGVFPFVGLILIWRACIKWLQWKRFKNLELEMDPFPASPGGDAGGSIELPIKYVAGKTVDVTLSCIHITITRSGKSNSRHETVLWRERAAVSTEASMRGSRVHFHFSLPDDLPTTTTPSNNYITWAAHLHRKLPGADLDQTFELAVLESDSPKQSRSLRHYSNETLSEHDVPEDNVTIDRSGGGLSLYYPASRGRGKGILLTLFGLVFCLVPGFLIFNRNEFSSVDAFSLIFFAFGSFFVLIFGLVALFMICFGVFRLFNKLRVRVDSAGLTSTRYFLGLRFEHALARNDIQQLRFKINAQQSHGARATLHYLLEAIPKSGKPVCLGDGIKGKPLAQKLMQELGSALHIDNWQENTRRSLRNRPPKTS